MRHRLSAVFSRTKVSDSLPSITRDALMFIARTRTCFLRGLPIARLYHNAAKMEKRDYAVGQQQCACGLS